MERHLQLILRIVRVRPTDRYVCLIYPHDPGPVARLLLVGVIVHLVAVLRVSGGLLGHYVEVDAVLVHGRGEKLVNVKDFRKLILYAVAVLLLGDRRHGLPQLDEFFLKAESLAWRRFCGLWLRGCCSGLAGTSCHVCLLIRPP